MQRKFPKPSQEELQKYNEKWQTLPTLQSYVAQEKALRKLFCQSYAKNTNLDEILVKVATLNDFYSTNIFNVFEMAKHIERIKNLDERLGQGDESLVGEIARVNFSESFFYSFATKFCSHHNEKDFPIFDNYISKVLIHCKSVDKFTSFTAENLKEYKKFKQILFVFKEFYSLECDFKALDRYLWQLGREYLRKKMKNRLNF